VGLAGVAALLTSRLAALRRLALPAVTLVALGLQGSAGLPLHPYELAYYNPLVGGPALAPKVLLVGWGEGIDQAVRALNARPDADGLVVASWYATDYSPSFRGNMIRLTDYTQSKSADVDYYIYYVNQVQRNTIAHPVKRCREAGPAATVRLNGIEYAWVCR